MIHIIILPSSILHLLRSEKPIIMIYNYETILVDIEELENCCNELLDTEILRIANTAKENFIQIAVATALPHFLIKTKVLDLKHIQYSLEGAVATKNSLRPTTEGGKKELNEYIKSKLESNAKEHSEEARQILNELREKNPHIESAIHSTALNSLVNIWTIFESVSKELWIYILNKCQNQLLSNILESKTDNPIEGITGKYISISLLSKFDFNINNKLGHILASKYDFTSCRGIQKSFSDLQKQKKNTFDFLNDKNLYELELIRNLIVHNAGFIDTNFIQKTSKKNIKISDKIVITPEECSDYENAVIHSIVKLIKYSNNLIFELQ